MNGVVVLSTRNGACLYTRRWAPNFGLRGDFGDAADSTSSELAGDDIDGASSPAAMHLSGMIFALDLDYPSALERETEAILACMESEDWEEGIRAFVEKRKARFLGR